MVSRITKCFLMIAIVIAMAGCRSKQVRRNYYPYPTNQNFNPPQTQQNRPNFPTNEFPNETPLVPENTPVNPGGSHNGPALVPPSNDPLQNPSMPVPDRGVPARNASNTQNRGMRETYNEYYDKLGGYWNQGVAYLRNAMLSVMSNTPAGKAHYNAEICKLAQDHANAQAAAGAGASHDGKDYRFAQISHFGGTGGEIVAISPTLEGCKAQWAASPGHAEIMNDGSFKEGCTTAAKRADGSLYCVGLYAGGTPKRQSWW